MSEPIDNDPANENANPFARFDTALNELYRLRREVLSRNTEGFTFELWQQRKASLAELDASISLCLRNL